MNQNKLSIDRREGLGRYRSISFVKVVWKGLSPKEATWEAKDNLWKCFPRIYVLKLVTNFEDKIYYTRGLVVTY